MDEREIRMRCVEAAAKIAPAHRDGMAAGVREAASAWFDWITRQTRQEHVPERAPAVEPGKALKNML